MMNLARYTFVIFLFGLFFFPSAYPQEVQAVEKSIITENIDGKEFYLHFIKKGETLFAIARAYGVTTNDIFRANPGSSQGITDGQILKIPKEKVTEQPDAPGDSKDTYFLHIVKKQETLYGISRKYGISVEQVVELNPEMGEYPVEGQTLKIPIIQDDMGLMESKWEGNSTTHTVLQGESLYGIAREYEVTIGEIKNANPGLGDILSIGSVLIIPNQMEEELEVETQVSVSKPDYPIHEVVAGETLYGIARIYAVPVDTLKKYNPGLTSALSPGQEIKIPPADVEIEFIVHKPDKNESMAGISELYDVELDELSRMNPGIKRKAKKGQVVRIPVEPREPDEVVNQAEEEAVEEGSSDHCFDGESHKQNVYNVALMLPMFLEEIDSTDFDNEEDFAALSSLVSFRFVNFYAGFRMALDSMVNKGMKVNLFVYDVDNDIKKAEKVMMASELSSMDLIVGPFYLTPFRKLAEYARTYQIPIVNPLSRREELIYRNPFVYKLKPSEEQQVDLLVGHLQNTYPTGNILIVRNNKYKYQKEVSYIRNALNSNRPTHTYISNETIVDVFSELDHGKTLFTENKLLEVENFKNNLEDSTYFSNLVKEVIYVDDSITGLSMSLSKIRPNIVVTISDEIVFSKEILSQLNKLNQDHDITLFGLPDWNSFTDLETNHQLNLNLHTFTSTLVDYNNPRIQTWISNYRETYKTEPGSANYAFDGFDAGWYFLNALYYYGRDFGECLTYLTIPLIQTQFDFEKKDMNGYQNIFWNLGIYQNYQYHKVYINKD